MSRKTNNKWCTLKCCLCGDMHSNYSGKLDSKGKEYVICGGTQKKIYVHDDCVNGYVKHGPIQYKWLISAKELDRQLLESANEAGFDTWHDYLVYQTEEWKKERANRPSMGFDIKYGKQ